MKAVRIHQFGGPEVLTYEDFPEPTPRKDQVLVRVRACALNHLDLWVRNGLPGVNLPHILGSDIAGEVVETGEYVSGFKPGQRVLLAPMHFCNHCAKCVAGLQNQCPEFTVLGNRVDGGNCELMAVPAVNVIPIPDSLDFVQAASIPLVFLTAWHMLMARANGNIDMHRFLAIADGVVRAQGRKIIFTTNLPNIGDIDEALLRPGRCFASVQIRALLREEAARLIAKLCGNDTPRAASALGKAFPEGARSTSLANVFRALV